MSVYLTEEEQIEVIKKWWKKYGNHVLTAIIIILLAFTGWRWWQARHYKILTQASAAYESMLSSVASNDPTGVTAEANTIISNYPATNYANLARLMLARQAVYANDYKKAEQQLQTVIAKGDDQAIKQIARVRLARLLLAEKQTQQALTILQTVNAPSFLPLIEEVRGDIYLAMGNKTQARTEYAQAMTKLSSAGMGRKLLEMKLNDLADSDSKFAVKEIKNS